MVEITFSIDGVESSRNVRASSVDEAIEVFLDEYDGSDVCIVRTTGPWSVES